jgi:hypothetical protein
MPREPRPRKLGNPNLSDNGWHGWARPSCVARRIAPTSPQRTLRAYCLRSLSRLLRQRHAPLNRSVCRWACPVALLQAAYLQRTLRAYCLCTLSLTPASARWSRCTAFCAAALSLYACAGAPVRFSRCQPCPVALHQGPPCVPPRNHGPCRLHRVRRHPTHALRAAPRPAVSCTAPRTPHRILGLGVGAGFGHDFLYFVGGARELGG